MDSGVCERGEALNDDMTHTLSHQPYCLPVIFVWQGWKKGACARVVGR